VGWKFLEQLTGCGTGKSILACFSGMVLAVHTKLSVKVLEFAVENYSIWRSWRSWKL